VDAGHEEGRDEEADAGKEEAEEGVHCVQEMFNVVRIHSHHRRLNTNGINYISN
jgi:hypothetical protein